MYVGLLVEEEEDVSVSKISRREKGVSFVRSFVSNYNAVETSYQITCLVFLISESQERCMYSHFVAKALWRLKPDVFDDFWRYSDRGKK